jgi:phage-related minor tail protein
MPTEYVKAIDEGGKVAAATIATGIKGITIPADKNSFIEAANAMASILSGVRLGVAGGLITGTEGSMIKGKRASGGPVFGGEAYLVGEQGPELFVPQTSGTVVPNSALRGGGGNQIIQLQLDGRTIYEVVMNERGQRRNFREF